MEEAGTRGSVLDPVLNAAVFSPKDEFVGVHSPMIAPRISWRTVGNCDFSGPGKASTFLG